MADARAAILAILCRTHATWVAGERFYCHRGCSACCTNNVMVTGLEAEKILSFVKRENKIGWFAARLAMAPASSAIKRTTNGFARLCLQQEEGGDWEQSALPPAAPCPFLVEESCGIYEVRPFSCRSFASRTDCRMHGEATLPQRIVTINTVMLQLIEHLDRGGLWGNLIDVLLVLCREQGTKDIVPLLGVGATVRINAAEGNILRAESLPGFLLLAEEEQEIAELLREVHGQKVGTQRVGELLQQTRT